MARAFAREGANVFLAGRTLAKLNKVVKDITAAGGVGPQGVRVICLRSAGSPESFPDSAKDETMGDRRDEIAEMIAAKTLLKCAPKLAEVGNVAALMASDYASPMTATVANLTCGTIAD